MEISPEIEQLRIRPTIEKDDDDFRIRISHEQTAKEWRSDFAVELTGNIEALGYEEIKDRLAALSVIASNRQHTERAMLNYRDGFTEELEVLDEQARGG